MREAMLWEPAGDRVQCLLCPHACRIAEGKRGICGVRENRGGTLYALTYGRISSIAVDPIEKKPVFHYAPGTTALSVGSVGCTMKCEHCQNWQIARGTIANADLHDLSPERLVEIAESNGSAGLAFTYNEPVIWLEYVHDVSKAAHEAGLYSVMVTNGFITQAGLDAVGGLIDVWRVDVKGFDDSTYKSLCKVPSVKPVLQQAERARHHWNMHVEVVTNVVPTINDDEEQLRGIARWIRERLGEDTPWHITRFFPYLELSHLPPTPIASLRRAREIGAEEGLHFVYLGNVDEPGGEDTTCPQCGAVAIARRGYAITRRQLRDSACAACGRDLNIVER